MSYSVFVWCPPAPTDSEDALAVWERLVEHAEQDPPPPPRAELVAFGRALDRSVDEEPLGEEHCAWQGGPLAEDVVGDLLEITMFSELAEEGVRVVAEHARAHGLVCFDPQGTALLADPRAA